MSKSRIGSLISATTVVLALTAGPASADTSARFTRGSEKPTGERLVQHHGVTLALPDGTRWPQPYQRWAREAKVPTVPGLVTLRLAPCEHSVACAKPDEGWIAVAPGRRWDMRVQLLHELGHHFDARMPEWARAAFTEIMGLGTLGWRDSPAGSGTWGDGSPSEQFAQAYALCALAGGRDRDAVKEWDSVYGYWPTRRQHRRICALIASAR